jgi:hypothetical protein
MPLVLSRRTESVFSLFAEINPTQPQHLDFAISSNITGNESEETLFRWSYEQLFFKYFPIHKLIVEKMSADVICSHLGLNECR